MFAVKDSGHDLSVLSYSSREESSDRLSLESTLQQLNLYNFEIEVKELSIVVAKAFEANPLLPGVILIDRGKFFGMISRRKFLECLSRPYGVELFLKRPIESLYRFARTDDLILPANTLIVLAARQSLNRPPALLDEPIIVEIESSNHRILDVHQLLVASAKIQEITTHLLKKQTQAQMIQTEKMASLGRMVAGVAHEIRNPVNCLGGNVNFLANYFQDLMLLISAYEEDNKENNERSPRINEIKEEIEYDFLKQDIQKILQTMNIAADRLTKIVGSLRNFSHIDENNRKPADIHECIEGSLLILHNSLKNSIKLIINYGDLPLINCYSGQLSQVFINLISNAIDALLDKEEEKQQLTVDRTWQPQIEITTRVIKIENHSWAAIRINDNGPGIPLEIQGKIFDMFFTTKDVGKGTGIGLAISYQIITEKHGGKLNLYSQPGKGTEFEIVLPID